MKNIKKEKINRCYVDKVFEIDKTSIKRFIRPEWHREYRIAHVKTIANGLMKGNHFGGTITVNNINNKCRVIDGNHKISAINQVIKIKPSFSIIATVSEYNDLNRDEEMKIYEIINNTKAENSMDRLKAHCYDAYIIKEIMKSFPVTPLFRSRGKSEKNALPITQILAGYIHRADTRVSLIARDFDAIKTLADVDYDRLVSFFRLYVDTFGYFCHDNLYATSGFITALGKIYYNSVGSEISKSELIERCKKLQMRYSSQIQMFRNGSFEMQRDLYLFLLEKLSCRKPLFNVYEALKNEALKNETAKTNEKHGNTKAIA